ncbi:hypothetical protein PoB_004971800 [Plakobranchus ocellatus]|uniref:Uncharacterized protein n=1 Tax=Plakobranchus ocellatus TaxID=259542 RepID=A0AAV4BUC4_9GAST|nr:hypothetical protein PoB_004971800 [Plakobranchus ocellatus]
MFAQTQSGFSQGLAVTRPLRRVADVWQVMLSSGDTGTSAGVWAGMDVQVTSLVRVAADSSLSTLSVCKGGRMTPRRAKFLASRYRRAPLIGCSLFAPPPSLSIFFLATHGYGPG